MTHTSAFWTSLGAPSTLVDYNINDEQSEKIVNIAAGEMEYGGFGKS
ncbi:hypothetical protein [Paenibacillus sp. 203]